MQTLHNPNGNYKISYVKTEAQPAGRDLPGVIFLPGFKSDMQGSKAIFLEEKCAARGQGYIRFDYGGHGESEGVFTELCLSDWLSDAMLILDALTEKPQIVIGSSMGGWLALRLTELRADRIAGLIGIAPAPDFTREIQAKMTEAHHAMLESHGYIEEPSDYGEPYIFTKRLFEDGEAHCMLDRTLDYDGPVHILQGMEDSAVDWQKALRIKRRMTRTDARVTLIENGGHSLSEPSDLDVLDKVLAQMSGLDAALPEDLTEVNMRIMNP